MHPIRSLLLVIAFLFVAQPRSQAGDWPQFRGPNCTGHAPDGIPLPAEIGPDINVVWKAIVPPGHSSPAVVGDRVYMTAVQDKTRLVTLALDRRTGKQLWSVEAPAKALEQVHRIGSQAQSSPAADPDGVVSFFGSYGLICYDPAGRLVWERRMGPFKNDFGAGSSPVVVGDRVILCQDHDQGSFLEVLERRTGKSLWKVDRSEFLRGYCTPVVWESGGTKLVVVAGTLRAIGYDLATGREAWTVRGISRTVCMTPAVGDDGRLYVAGWAAGGDDGERIDVPAFDDVIGGLDKNQNGNLEVEELPKGPIWERFTQVDADKDGSITRAEYERFRSLFQKGRNVLLAIRPGGSGDVSETHVVWRHTRHVPFCASPLQVSGAVFTVKDGGFLATLGCKDGKVVKRDRLSAGAGSYYASPVTGDGKVFLVSELGKLTVVSAQAEWTEIGSADFKEEVYATPALAGGNIFVRTNGHLYCFGSVRPK